MTTTAIIALVLAVLAVLALVLVITTARRSDMRRAMGSLSRETMSRDSSGESNALTGRAFERAALASGPATSPGSSTSTALAIPAPAPPPAVWVAPDAEAVGVTRRHFFNVSAITLTLASTGAFGAACIGFLWPKLSGGFGSKINVGKLDDVKQNIKGAKGFFYLAEGRTWLTEYPVEALSKAKLAKYAPNVLAGMQAGVVALYQKCPHLGCRVPECVSSQWFECPCHGSQYNRVGEKKGGPAPRGMDHFAVSVVNGNVIVDTSNPILGPAIGTNTTGQEAEGPHCVGTGGKH